MDEKTESVRENILENKKYGKRKSVRFRYALEPAYFVLYYAFNLTSAVLQNQMLKQTCLTKGYSMSICTNLNTDDETKEVEELIQPDVARINMSILLLNSIFPGTFSLILGSWSDIYGRKKILMLSFIGYSTTLGLIALFSFISENVTTLSPWVYFFSEMPMTFLGGWPTLDIAVCCYVADLSTDKTRSFRLGLIGFFNFFGSATAYFTSSYILAATNITILFIIGFACSFTAMLWALFMVDDSIEPSEHVSNREQFKQIFSPLRIKEIFNSLCKIRPMKCRQILWALIAIPTLIVFTMHGNGTLNYLFVREQFEWSLRQWTTYESINSVLSVTGIFIGVMVLKKGLQISDMKLGILGLVSFTVDAIIKAFATQGYMLYVSSGITLFRLLSTPMFRSVMSVAVPHHEIGKVYSLTTCFEALSGLGAGPLYTAIYNNTFTVFTGAYHLLTATAFIIGLILSGFIVRWKSQGVTNQYD
ncbi:probable peptidoglycan muropeptide transporter SLC46 [Chironomus tepperi]|uniref:probable peptidoglycan muropeptide transporter SLC46 n=1 Tax=Chironomus tepperi TaxID=113505 RepID=UPI00391FC65D